MVEGRVDISPVKPKERYKYPGYRTYRECKYCPSCFECPLEDCKVALTVAVYRNALPEEISKAVAEVPLVLLRSGGGAIWEN